MRRTGLYSSADRSSPKAGAGSVRAAIAEAESQATPHADPQNPVRQRLSSRTAGWIRSRIGRYERTALVLGGVLLALAVMIARDTMQPTARVLTQEDIDKAVLHTLETRSLPSRAARAAEAVRQSIVRVIGYPDELDEAAASGKPGAKPALPPGHPKVGGDAGDGGPPEATGPGGRSTGSGVVIVDDGVILTNLHVIAGSKRITVTFFDGSVSEAVLIRAYPENDLAVLRAKTIPDDLPAATLGSTAKLRPGDEVVAVGFPFGVGPSVSAGVVSGMNRAFLSPKGKRLLTRLIQFDAAANPGNSGGPLVTMDGEVVGIVTAILSPHQPGTFIGIGFATTIEAAGGAVGIPPF